MIWIDGTRVALDDLRGVLILVFKTALGVRMNHERFRFHSVTEFKDALTNMTDKKYWPRQIRSTILLIGDSFGVLKQIAFALQHAGHTILWADSGRNGLRIVECEQPDLVISEIDVPDISGIDVCHAIKSDTRSFHIPTVLVGHADNEQIDLPRALEAGADEFVASFIDRRLTLAKLEWLMRRRNTGQTRAKRNEFSEKLFAGSIEWVT